MKTKILYGASRIAKKLAKGPVTLPEFVRLDSGEWIEDVTTISSLDEFNAYIERQEAIVERLKAVHHSDNAAKIYSNAFYALTSPANTTMAGRLLSGKVINSSKVFRSPNIKSAKDAIYGVLNTIARDDLAVVGKEVELPKVKRTSSQLLSMFKKGIEGYFVPQIDKDGLVVTAGDGKHHFDVNFVAVSSADVTEEQLREYLLAPFGEDAEAFHVDVDKIIDLCKKAYKGMCLNDDMYQKVRDIMHECAECYPLSFASMKNKDRGLDPVEPDPTEPDPTEPDPTEPDPTEPDPTEPDPTDPDPTEPDPTEPDPTEPDPTEPDPTEPDPTEPDPTEPARRFSLRSIRRSMIERVVGDKKRGFGTQRYSRTIIQELVEEEREK